MSTIVPDGKGNSEDDYFEAQIAAYDNRAKGRRGDLARQTDSKTHQVDNESRTTAGD